jgi:DNA-binding NtrC family response regulator
MDRKHSPASLACAPWIGWARAFKRLVGILLSRFLFFAISVHLGALLRPKKQPEAPMEITPQILIVSSELEHRRALNDILRKEGYETLCASRVSECQQALQTQKISLIFCDRRLSDGNYRDVVALTRASNQRIRVVVTSRLADWDEYLDALHHGAFDLIASPCQPTDVLWAMVQARREDNERAGFVAPTKARTASATA